MTAVGPMLLVLLLVSLGVLPALTIGLLDVGDSGVLLLLHVFAVSLLAVVLTLVNDELAIAFISVVLCFQPLLSMPWSSAVGGTGIRLLVATKEVTGTVIFTTLVLKHGLPKQMIVSDWAALALGGLSFLYTLASPAPLLVRIVSLREIGMVLVFYGIGRYLPWDREHLLRFIRMVLWLGIAVALIGYFERFLMSDDAWHFLGALDYIGTKRGDQNTALGALIPNQWYTFIAHDRIRRMVSTTGDPTSLSRLLSLPLLALFFVRDVDSPAWKVVPLRWLLIAVLAGAELLSIGRGGQAIVLLGLLIWGMAKRPKAGVVFGVPIIFALPVAVVLSGISAGSLARHVAGFGAGALSLIQAPLGHGMGTGGQVAVNYGTESAAEGIKESYFASLAFQMGIPGLMMFMAFGGLLAWVLLREYLRVRRSGSTESWLALLAMSCVLGIWITCLLANSAIAPISAGQSMILAGLMANYSRERAARTGGALPAPAPT